MNFNTLKERVHNKIREETIQDILEFLKEFDLNLWAIKKPQNFITLFLYTILYKNITAIGYGELQKEIHSFFKISQNSLTHNQKEIWEVLNIWGDLQIVVGFKKD